MTLQEIGTKHKTDKAITHFYMGNYEKYFESWRDKYFTLLEIGVAGGASLKTWKEYFVNARVYGIDNNPDCAGEGVFIGSQNDKEFLDSVLEKIGTPDIIIDDGSHYAPYTIETFQHLFKQVMPGGWYIVEDTHCFYDKTYGEAPDYGNGMSEVFKFFTSLAADVDIFGRAMTGNHEYAINANIETPPVPKYSRLLESIHIHTSLWLFKRR